MRLNAPRLYPDLVHVDKGFEMKLLDADKENTYATVSKNPERFPETVRQLNTSMCNLANVSLL